MSRASRRLERERLTVAKMVEIYCRAHHAHGVDVLCPNCAEFMDYADRRLEKCPYGVRKPTCANCPIHCYKPARREQVREIMQYSGPRMLLRHPVLAIRHKLDGLIKVRHPLELGREERIRTKARRADRPGTR